MASLLEKLKNTPFINAQDTKSKKRIAIVVVMIIIIILLVIINAMKDGEIKKTEPRTPAVAVEEYQFLDVPEGSDDGYLENTNMIEAREMQARHSNKDIYEQAGGDDPLKDVFSEEKKENQDVEPEADQNPESSKEAAKAFLFGGSIKNTPRRVNPAPEAAVVTAKKPSSDKPANTTSPKKKKTSSGSKPKSADTGASSTASQPAPQEPDVKPAEASAATVPVRKSGSISSLDDWGSIEGLSSLDDDDVYVNTDEDHPYRVMFTKDMKIQSGQRVTLRLLEDMAVEGILIPKNTHLAATCRIGDRLEIYVSNIEINGKIYNLGYVAFDNDGSEGLYCPQSKESRKAQQTTRELSNIAQSALTSTLASAGSLMGQVGRVGASAVLDKDGAMEANITSGYEFFLLKDKNE